MSKEPNPDKLVLPWTETLASSEAPLPFLVKYKREGKAVYYLAAEHSNKLNDETFKLLTKTSGKFKAEVFLVEGFETEKGYSPEDIKASALEDGANGHFKGGESVYATQLALKKKIPFKGIEPTKVEIFEELQKEKFTAQDMIHYYFVRQIPKWREAGTLDPENIETMYSKFVTSIAQQIGATEIPTYDDFLVWYKSKNKETFNLAKVRVEKSAPIHDGRLFTQRLSSSISRARDRHMVRVIQDELKTKDRVFVVVGGKHWMAQKLALEALSGFPSFEYKQH